MISNQYPSVKVSASFRRKLAGMSKEEEKAPEIVRELVMELFSNEELKNKSFRQLSDDGSQRIELIQSKFFYCCFYNLFI